MLALCTFPARWPIFGVGGSGEEGPAAGRGGAGGESGLPPGKGRGPRRGPLRPRRAVRDAAGPALGRSGVANSNTPRRVLN